jgi:hypothetical protein
VRNDQGRREQEQDRAQESVQDSEQERRAEERADAVVAIPPIIPAATMTATVVMAHRKTKCLIVRSSWPERFSCRFPLARLCSAGTGLPT